MKVSRRHLLGAALAAPFVACADVHRLRVLAPAPSLRELVFWTAMGGGAFVEAGLEVDLDLLEHASQAGPALAEARVDAAILDGGTTLGLLARDAPVSVVGRLWAREPATVVVHRRVVEGHPPIADTSLSERAAVLEGRRVAMAPALEARFRALWRDAALSEARPPQILRVDPRRQNLVLARGDAEALFATSPVLEHALVRQGARVLVAPCRGQVPSLDGIAGSSVVVGQAVVEARPHAVVRLLAGLAQATAWIHRRPQVAVTAALEVVPDRLPREVEEGVFLLRSAVPADPRPRVAALFAQAPLVSVDGPHPRRAQVEARVEPRFAAAAVQAEVSRAPLGWPLSMMAAGGLVGWWLRG